jgi:phosphinothricin acetyltransferase
MKITTDTTRYRGIHIRIAELTDLAAIVDIYNQAVPTQHATANTTPVTVEGRKSWFVEHEPDRHPIFVAVANGQVVGWCSLSAYRPGRFALRFTAEISYYIEKSYQGQGVGSLLVDHAIQACASLGIKNLIAVVIDRNMASQKLLEKLGFERWGYLPGVLDFEDQECGEFYYGRRVSN